jgi:hypothetical protein
MANGDFVQVTAGTGKKLATGPTYTEGANIVQDEKVILGEPYIAAYSVSTVTGLGAAVSNAHFMQLMAGAALKVYVRRIRVFQSGLAAAAALIDVRVVRLTSAGTGGGVIVPAQKDNSDAAGATAMTLPTVKGNEGAQLDIGVGQATAVLSAASARAGLIFEGIYDDERSKAIVIPAGAANGIALKTASGATAATLVLVVIDFSEAAF